MKPTDVIEWIGARGGIVHRDAVLSAGFGARALRATVASSALRRIGRSWLVAPGAPDELVTAARAGGRLACVSVARQRKWWMPDGVGPNVHVHRHPHAFVPPLSPPVTAHWSIPVVAVSPHALTESIEDALAHIASCLPREDALVLWESAARRERLSPEALRQVRWKTVAARECAEATTGLSDSGLETIVVVRLSPWGVPMRQQTVLAGRPVDLLIGERLVIQLDGFAYHSSAADRRRDIEHDAELAARGYTVLRFTYSQVLHDWIAVERSIARALARGAHLA